MVQHGRCLAHRMAGLPVACVRDCPCSCLSCACSAPAYVRGSPPLQEHNARSWFSDVAEDDSSAQPGSRARVAPVAASAFGGAWHPIAGF